MSIPLSTLGLSAGGTVDFFVAYCSSGQFNSNESIPAYGPLNSGGNPGTAGPSAGYGTFDRFVVFTNHVPTANSGGPYSMCQGASLQLNASATTDADIDDVLTYQWDLAYNGSFSADFTTNNPILVLTAAQLSSVGISSPGTYDLYLRVSDSQGGVSTALTTITVTPPPTTAIAAARAFA
jgi:hypothetical protein